MNGRIYLITNNRRRAICLSKRGLVCPRRQTERMKRSRFCRCRSSPHHASNDRGQRSSTPPAGNICRSVHNFRAIFSDNAKLPAWNDPARVVHPRVSRGTRRLAAALPDWAQAFLAMHQGTSLSVCNKAPNHRFLLSVGYAQLNALNEFLPESLAQRFPLLFPPFIEEASKQDAVEMSILLLALQYAQKYPNSVPAFAC